MRGRRIAVEVKAAGRFQHPVNLDTPQRHMDEICEQRAVPEDFLQPADQLNCLFSPITPPPQIVTY